MTIDSRRQARILAIQFLYQCEVQEVFYFSAPLFAAFKGYIEQSPEVSSGAMKLCQGILADVGGIDRRIESSLVHWSLSRIATVDKCVLRLGVYELLSGEAPKKAVLNEAVELARLFGTEKSSGFVNGVLDAAYRQ